MIPVILESERTSDGPRPKATLYYGENAITVLKQLPEKSVHSICTSPPYWGLREYGTEPQEWPEVQYSQLHGVSPITVPAETSSLGLESNPQKYIAHLVEICREARRVLRDDGTLWVNIGDGYVQANQHLDLPEKNLIGIPWLLGLALQADGWFLRSDIIWAKNRFMPEPVQDRPVRSHEYVLQLSKSPFYFFDAEAVRENDTPRTKNDPLIGGPRGRNRRDVWLVSTVSYKSVHFATWPPRLVELMIIAGTSEKGCCPHCGAPWKRDVELVGGNTTGRRKIEQTDKFVAKRGMLNTSRAVGQASRKKLFATHVTRGWLPTCDCENNDPIPCTVMDIFSGSGTTGQMALSRNRDYVGLDLNADYLDIAKARILDYQPPTKEESATKMLEAKQRKWEEKPAYDFLSGEPIDDMFGEEK